MTKRVDNSLRSQARALFGLLALAGIAATASAQTSKSEVLAWLDAQQATYADIAQKIWSYAEVGYKEHKSSALLQEQLRREGFSVEVGVAGMPTAFVASYGSGQPVIAILGEFDALPGVSQDAVPERKPREGVNAGHACGHHLFGAGSAAAAVAVKRWLQATKQTGTIRYYGCPAEEGGSGKVYLARAGLFANVTAVLHWHPFDFNSANQQSNLAVIAAKFRFRGIASHAALAPDQGRSALDGVEAFNHMVNLMREHVPQEARLHYVITKGGEAPNVVPALAETYYYVRHPKREILQPIWQRVQEAAKGAALGTGTTVDWEVHSGCYEILPNHTLGKLLHANLTSVGGVKYTAEERAFAEKVGGTLTASRPAPEQAEQITPFRDDEPPFMGSTDVGDVSWLAPTAWVVTATWAPGTPAHSWQAVACGGSTIGLKGMQVAAKTLALTAMDLFTRPEELAKAKSEFEKARGPDFKYVPLLGDRAPALNYRD